LAGPERLSTLGVRAVREQTAVGSSLFAQPLMLAPVPLDEPAGILAPSDPTHNLSSRPEAAQTGAPIGRYLPEWGGLADAVEGPAFPAQVQNLSSRPESAPFADAVERPASSA